MVIFVESPWPILFIGIAAEAVLAFLLLRTGLGKFLIAMIGVAVLIAAGLIVERLVVTDRERVEQTLDAAVAAVRRNDLQRRAGLHFAVEPRGSQLDDAGVWPCRIPGGAHQQSGDQRQPPDQSAYGRSEVPGRGQRTGPQRVISLPGFSQRVNLELRLEGGRWLVTGYEFEGSGKL